MENRLQTSFMPKRPVVGGPGEPLRKKSPPNLLMIIGVLIFILTIAAFGGLYWYEGVLVKSNEAKRLQIEEAIRNFEPELTKKLTVLKTRIDSGKQLLSNHIAFSSVLGLLESNTAVTVRFTEMNFSVTSDASTREQKMSIALKGEAQGYSSVAFQSDLFAKNENIRNPIFSDLNLNEKGLVGFIAKADVVSASMLYRKTLPENMPVTTEQQISVPPQQQATSTPGTASTTNNQTES